MGWKELMSLGKNESNAEISRREKNQAVNKACMYIYTSGTTGPPKGKNSCYRRLNGIDKIIDVSKLLPRY